MYEATKTSIQSEIYINKYDKRFSIDGKIVLRRDEESSYTLI